MLYLHFTELHKIKIPSICLWLNFILILTLLSPARAPAHSSRAASTALGGSYHSTSIRLIFSIFLSPIFFLFVCLVCFFYLFKSLILGKGVLWGRMRNSVPLLCLWSFYCCFAAEGPALPGPEGRLQGNVHLFLLPPQKLLSCAKSPLSRPPFFSLSSILCHPSSFPPALSICSS